MMLQPANDPEPEVPPHRTPTRRAVAPRNPFETGRPVSNTTKLEILRAINQVGTTTVVISPRRKVSAWLYWPSLGLAIATTLLIPLAAMSVLYVHVIGVLVILISLVPFVIAWSWFIFLESRNTPRQSDVAITNRECKSCGYCLHGVGPAIHVTIPESLDIGPELCPECGIAWPMIMGVSGERR
jgi:hypothetical protein